MFGEGSLYLFVKNSILSILAALLTINQTKMKKSIAFLALFLLSLGISAQQTFMLQPTIIHPEDAQDFEMIQKKYAQGLAQDAVDSGILQGWALLKRVPTGQNQEVNYLWVHVFENVEKMANRKAWWTYEKKYGIPGRVLYGGIDRKGYGNFFYKTEKRYDNSLNAKYVLFNWAYPKDLNSAMDLADKISNNFKNSMKKEGMASWGMATRIIPQGADNAPLFFWDAYESLEQVMNHLMNKAIVGTVDQNLIGELLEELPNGWENRVIWEFVARTN